MQIETMAIEPKTLSQLRVTDDAGRPTVSYVDAEGGAPLRCCLRRSDAGDVVALVSYAPLRRWAAQTGVDPGAYLELGPVFIHGVECPGPGKINELATAARVVRAYDKQGRILGGTLAQPDEIQTAMREWFNGPQTALVHVRAVEFGCFMFEARRSLF
jgi:hypothetical protein